MFKGGEGGGTCDRLVVFEFLQTEDILGGKLLAKVGDQRYQLMREN